MRKMSLKTIESGWRKNYNTMRRRFSVWVKGRLKPI